MDWMTVLKDTLTSHCTTMPIPPLPRPPPPRGRGRRPANRYRRAVALWQSCEKTRAALNTCWDSRWVAEQEVPPPPSRFKHAHVPTAVRESWFRLVVECRRIVAGRRDAFREWPTGAELYLQLVKREGDLSYVAGRAAKKADVYVPFSANAVDEPPVDHRTVDLLAALPEHVAARYADPVALFHCDSHCEAVRAPQRTILSCTW